MQVIKSLEDIRISERTAVAVGNFDGVHMGHRTILESAVDCAHRNGFLAVCYTFSNHPVNFFMEKNGMPEKCVKLICTEADKLGMLEKLGFDIVVNVPFDENVMTMRAMDFIHAILKDKLNAAAVCCGFNYSFGVKAEGNVELLKSECSNLGITVNVHDAVEIDGTVVSSTEIRKLIKEGDMELLTRFLGRPYALSGTVSHGLALGREIGFPTMNITAPMTMALPPNGVYFTNAAVGGETFKAITNIGVKPTVEYTKVKSIETNIFDFNDDVYDAKVTIEFLKWERPEVKFDNIEALTSQISHDVNLAMEYHGLV